MSNLIKDVSITYDNVANKVSISITDLNDRREDIEAAVTNSGTFRFSYKYPESKKKYKYQGVFHKNKVVIYPIVGEGVISKNPLSYAIND